jgi:hypothetical protein
VIGSFLTIALLVAMLLAFAQLGTSQRASDLAEKAFNAVLPVLASWVGTVLAFFFSSQSQERTSNSLDKAINAATGTGDGKTVTEVMIPLGQIRELVDLAKEPAITLSLDTLQKKFTVPPTTAAASSATSTAPPVTRLVFVDSNVFRYVLHSSALNAFLVATKNATPAPTVFEDMRRDPNVLQQISRLVVFVPASAKLSDASTALDRVKGAQDIIVTATGNSSDPMLGWITNVDLIKALNGP